MWKVSSRKAAQKAQAFANRVQLHLYLHLNLHLCKDRNLKEEEG